MENFLVGLEYFLGERVLLVLSPFLTFFGEKRSFFVLVFLSIEVCLVN